MLQFSRPNAEIFVPDQLPREAALARTTHLGIGAHADDLEIMAVHGILSCFSRTDRWFTGVVVSDGAGSARHAEYLAYSDEQLRAVRRLEQRKAAYVGEYAAQVLLDHPSSALKTGEQSEVIADLVQLLRQSLPEVVYTHNLADKHDTHVAVALRVIRACRELEPELRPKQLIGCEVWRDLDWLCDTDKLAMKVSDREHLQSALLGVFDSQLGGGKRYDLAALGRRKANATFFESHEADRERGLVWGMDLSRLMHEGDPAAHLRALLARFQDEVEARLRRLGE